MGTVHIGARRITCSSYDLRHFNVPGSSEQLQLIEMQVKLLLMASTAILGLHYRRETG
jgi:hypothetical protein